MAQLVPRSNLTAGKPGSDTGDHCEAALSSSGRASSDVSATSSLADDLQRRSGSPSTRPAGAAESSAKGSTPAPTCTSRSTPPPASGSLAAPLIHFNILVVGASNLGKTRFITDLARACGGEPSDALLDSSTSLRSVGSFPRPRAPRPSGSHLFLRSATLDNRPQELITRLPPLELPGPSGGGSGSRGVLQVSLLEGPAHDEQPNRALLLAKLLEYVLRQRERDYRTALAAGNRGGSRGDTAAAAAALRQRVHSVSLCLFFLSPNEAVSPTDLSFMAALSRELPLLPVLASAAALGPAAGPGGGAGGGAGWLAERRLAVVEAMRGYVRNGKPTPIPSLLEEAAPEVRDSGGGGGGGGEGRPVAPAAAASTSFFATPATPDADADLFRQWLMSSAEAVLHSGEARYHDFVQRYESYGNDLMCMLAELMEPYEEELRQAASAAAAATAAAAISAPVCSAASDLAVVATASVAAPVAAAPPMKQPPEPLTPDLCRSRCQPLPPTPTPTYKLKAGVEPGVRAPEQARSVSPGDDAVVVSEPGAVGEVRETGVPAAATEVAQVVSAIEAIVEQLVQGLPAPAARAAAETEGGAAGLALVGDFVSGRGAEPPQGSEHTAAAEAVTGLEAPDWRTTDGGASTVGELDAVQSTVGPSPSHDSCDVDCGGRGEEKEEEDVSATVHEGGQRSLAAADAAAEADASVVLSVGHQALAAVGAGAAAANADGDAAAIVHAVVRRAFAATVANSGPEEGAAAAVQSAARRAVMGVIANAAAAEDAAVVHNVVHRALAAAIANANVSAIAERHQAPQLPQRGPCGSAPTVVTAMRVRAVAVSLLVRRGLVEAYNRLAKARAAMVGAAYAIHGAAVLTGSASTAAVAASEVRFARQDDDEDALIVHGIVRRAVLAAIADVDAAAAGSRNARWADQGVADVKIDDSMAALVRRVLVRVIQAAEVSEDPCACAEVHGATWGADASVVQVRASSGSATAAAAAGRPQPVKRTWQRLGSELLAGRSPQRGKEMLQHMRSFLFSTTTAGESRGGGSSSSSSGSGRDTVPRSGGPVGLSMGVGLGVGVAGLAAGTLVLLALRHKQPQS